MATINGTINEDFLFGTQSADVINGLDGRDYLSGGDGADLLNGGEGEDYFEGDAGADTLIGGTGPDGLQGGEGADTYVYNKGDGYDTIDNRQYVAAADKLVLGAEFNAGNIRLNRDGVDLVITFSNSPDDYVRVVGHFAGKELPTVQFIDGTTLNISPSNLNNPVYSVAQTIGAQVYGYEGKDVMRGTPDRHGWWGYNNDSFYGYGGNDSIDGGIGTDYLFGGEGNDTLTGGWDGDYLEGGEGADTYIYNLGGGYDTIQNTQFTTAADKLLLGAGINAGNIRLDRVDNDLYIRFDSPMADDGDAIRILNHFAGSELKTLQFIDGSTLDISPAGTSVTVNMAGAAGGAGDDSLQGLLAKDVLNGLDGNDHLFGNGGNDTLYGGADDDELQGGAGNDWLLGGTGADVMVGGEGADFYVFNMGDGQDMIDNSQSVVAADKLMLGAGISAADLKLIRNGDDLYIAFYNSPDDSIRIKNHFAGAELKTLQFNDGKTFNLALANTANLLFADGGAADDNLQGYAGKDALAGNAGNDSLYGSGGNDSLTGGAGDDALNGGEGADIYVFNLGDGHDTIDNSQTVVAADKLVLGAGFVAANVVLTRDNNDLLISFNNSAADSVRVLNHFAGAELKTLQFSNSKTMSIAAANFGHVALPSASINGTAGNDSLYGNAGANVLYGGAGDDYLDGGDGADTYVFNRGDGHDSIANTETTSAIDKVLLGVGFTAANTRLNREGDDLVVSFANSIGDSIRILHHFGVQPFKVLQFSDNSTLNIDPNNIASIIYVSGSDGVNDNLYFNGLAATRLVMTGKTGNDQLLGNDGNDALDGGADEDALFGGNGIDMLTGGAGNDYLEGGEGADVYVFNLGDGQDTIANFQFTDAADKLLLGAGLSAANVRLYRDSTDLLIRFGDNSGDSIRVQNHFAGSELKILQFADGSTLNISVNSSATTVYSEVSGYGSGYDGKDVMTGSASNDGMYGLFGNDSLYGGAGGDYLAGNEGNDTLAGGSGDDMLEGGEGADVYVFNLEDGHDTILNYQTTTAADKLVFGAGLNAADMRLTHDGNDLVISFVNDNPLLYLPDDSVRLQNFYMDSELKTLQFDNGSTLNISQSNTANTIYSNGGADNDYLLSSYNGKDIMAAGAGDDLMVSFGGNDYLDGGDGDDNLHGGVGNDTLYGGLGDDNLVGDDGTDIYIFNVGDGHDTIQNYQSVYAADKLALGSGFSAADVRLNREGNDLFITFNNSASDSVRIVDHYYGQELKTLRFSDSTAISLSLSNTANTLYSNGTAGDDFINTLYNGKDVLDGGDGDDMLNTSGGNDSVDGGAGNDILWGEGGNDTLNGGIGDDTLWGMDGNDSLNGGVGDDSFFGETGNDTLDGGTGKDTLWGQEGNDTLKGGAGDDDYLYGGDGADSYVFNLGDGHDAINNYQSLLAADKLMLGAGFSAANVQLNKDGLDLVITFSNSLSDSVRVLNHFLDTELKTIQFSNNSTLNIAATNLANTFYSTGAAGDDYLEGYAGKDVITGNQGDDSLYGGAGNDIYRFARADGIDTLFEDDATVGNTDQLSFLSGVAHNQLWFSHIDNNLEVSLIGTTDKVVIQDWYSGSAQHVEQIKTVDGNKTLRDSKVENLVAAMASLTPPPLGQTSLTAAQHSQLDAVIAASWS